MASDLAELVEKIEREPLRVSDYVAAHVERGDAAGALAAEAVVVLRIDGQEAAYGL